MMEAFVSRIGGWEVPCFFGAYMEMRQTRRPFMRQPVVPSQPSRATLLCVIAATHVRHDIRI